MLDPYDDWPDAQEFDLLDPPDMDQLRAWVDASTLRALSSDGSYLYLARRRKPSDSLGTVNAPPDEDEAGVPTLDVFCLGKSWGYIQFHPGVGVNSLATKGDILELQLRISPDLMFKLSLQDSEHTLDLPTNPFSVIGVSINPSEEEALTQLAKLMKAGGVSSHGIDWLIHEASEKGQLYQREREQYAAEWRNAYIRAAQASDRYGVPSELRPQFDDAIRETGLEDRRDLIETFTLSGLRLEVVEGEAPALGKTRIGGAPDLPEGADWPADEEGNLYTFVLQLQLSDLPDVPGCPLPRQGLLQFYAGHCEDASDPGGKIVLVEGPVREVAIPKTASWTEDHNRFFSAHPVVLHPTLSVPGYGSEAYDILDLDALLGDDYRAYSRFEELAAGTSSTPDSYGGSMSYIAGHPYSLYGDIGTALAFRRHGQRDSTVCGMSPSQLRDEDPKRLESWEWWHANMDQVARDAHEWICLLDLDSHMEVHSEAGGMCWWDAGRLQFLIHRDDLANRRFDEARFELITT